MKDKCGFCGAVLAVPVPRHMLALCGPCLAYHRNQGPSNGGRAAGAAFDAVVGPAAIEKTMAVGR